MTEDYKACCKTPKDNTYLHMGTEFCPIEGVCDLPTRPKSAVLDADADVTKGNSLEKWTARSGHQPAPQHPGDRCAKW